MIGQNIKKLRLKKGISQDRLSKLADLSLNTIVKVESGKNPNPRIATLQRIAKAMDAQVGDLLKIILIALALLILTPGGYCEEAQVSKADLSVKDAVALAYKNNRDIQIQEQGIEIAKAGVLGTRSGFLPKVNIGTSYTHNDYVPRAAHTPGEKKDPSILFGYNNDNLAEATVSQVIYDGGAVIASYKEAKVNMKSSLETLRAKKLSVEFEARRLYYGLLLAYDTARIAKELVDQAQSHYEDVKKKFGQGTSSKFDLLQSKVAVSQAMPQLVKAESSVDLIGVELKKLLGLKLDFVLTPKESLAYSSIEIKEAQFLQEAYLSSPEMNLRILGIDMNKWNIQMALSGWRPQINAAGSYYYRSNAWSDMINNEHNNWQLGLSLSFPIFDAWSTKAKVDEAKAKYAQSVLQKDDMHDQIAVDIRRSCLDLKQSEQIIISQKDSVDEAKESLRLANIRYDNGVGTNLDVLDTQVSLAQVQLNLSQGIYDYLMAEAYLDRTRGRSLIQHLALSDGQVSTRE
jgi:outer membrane protein